MIEAFSYRLLQLEKEIHLISFCVLGFTPIIYIISSILSLFKIEKISSITKDSKHSDEIKWGSHKKVQKVWSAPWYFLSIEIFLLYLWSKRFHLLPDLFLIFIVNGDILLHFWSRRLFWCFLSMGRIFLLHLWSWRLEQSCFLFAVCPVALRLYLLQNHYGHLLQNHYGHRLQSHYGHLLQNHYLIISCNTFMIVSCNIIMIISRIIFS